MDMQTYKQDRKQGIPAKQAFEHAKYVADAPNLEWDNSNHVPTYNAVIDGFDIVVTLEPDSWPDLSWIGEFSNTPEDGAIDHEHGNSRTVDYFNSANIEYAKENYDRMMAYQNGHWHMMVIVASAYKSGVELGREALSSVESDSEQAYIDYTALELADEAITEAKGVICALCESL